MEENNNLESEQQKKELTGVPLILKLLQLDKDCVFENAPVFLFTDQFNEAYAAIESNGAQVMGLESKEFQTWLLNFVYELSGKANENSIKSALKILKYKASDFNFPLSVRVHKKDGIIYYDLKTDEFVEIDSEGWRLVETYHKLFFRRFNHQKKQDEPVEGGSLNDLLKLVNLSEKKDEILFKVYIVAAFIPEFPHPVLVVQGPQGSAKSTLCRLIKDLVDPSNLETHSLHGDKDIKQFVQTASHHWLLVLDNLSSLSNEVSDIISRICTGGGLSKRILYSNDDDFIYNFKHLIVLNGITQVVYKPDLLDRSIIVQLERIAEESRRTEDELWNSYHQLKPGILGAIFDTVARALKEYPNIEVKQLPRMADFVKWGCAIAKALGYTQEDFLKAYSENTKIQTNAAVDANPLVKVIADFMDGKDYYENEPGILYKEITKLAEDLALKDSPGWPKAANTFSKQIPLVLPVLQTLGLKISTSKAKKRKITIIRFRKEDYSDDTVQQSSTDKTPDFTSSTDDTDSYDGMIPF